MIVDQVQRWNGGRASYRPAGEPICTRLYEVAPIAADRVARAFVEQHHYSRRYVAARFRYGLFTGGRLVGVAVYSVPMNDRALAPLPGQGLERIELGRFVLLDEVPANGESWFLARTFEHLRREGLKGVIAFSDPESRTDAAGATVRKGHLGTLYQASNAVYLARGTARTLSLLPDGDVFSDRAQQKIRAKEQGWGYATRQLVVHGATPLGPRDDGREWLRFWMPQICRPMRHGGNHRYAWALDRRDRRHLPESLPYPKLLGSLA